MKCQVCGKDCGETRGLIGGYWVRLCADCADAWLGYVKNLPLWEEYMCTWRRLKELEAQFYRESEKWVEERAIMCVEQKDANL